MPIDVLDLVFDDANEAKLAAHRVTILEVLEVLDHEPRFFRNRVDRRASHVMVGPTSRDGSWSCPSRTGALASGGP